MRQKDNIKLLYIDLFCGAGGTSTGVEKATFHGDKCAKVIACVNHDANAIASHAANHPDAIHYTEDIRTLDLTSLVMHTMHMRLSHPYAHLVLWASLECTNFSKAKGGMPRNADSPATIQIKEFMALYGIADIRMRMLRIPELKRIMGFPEDYTLIGTQAEQKKFIGNAVEVNMARVLCEALCKRLNQKKQAI